MSNPPAVSRARIVESLEACHSRFLELYPPTVVLPKRPSRDTFVPADPKVTCAYAALAVAHAAETIGAFRLFEKLERPARRLLSRLSDPVHAFALKAFSERIDAACRGKPHESPLALSTRQLLGKMEAFERYKADRFRMFSYLLEPLERTDPAVGFSNRVAEIGGSCFASLRSIGDPAKLEERLEAALNESLRALPSKTSDILENTLDFLPILEHDRAQRFLRRLIARDDSLALLGGRVLEKALVVALYLEDDRAIGRLVTEAVAHKRQLSLAPFGRVLWKLKAAGHDEVVAKLASALLSPSSRARGAGEAAGLFALAGDVRRARRRMDKEVDGLANARISYAAILSDRAISFALAGMPPDYALEVLRRMAEQSCNVSDSFSTNTHVSIIALGLMDAIALGHEVVASSNHLSRTGAWPPPRGVYLDPRERDGGPGPHLMPKDEPRN